MAMLCPHLLRGESHMQDSNDATTQDWKWQGGSQPNTILSPKDAASGWFEQLPDGTASDVSAWFGGNVDRQSGENVTILGAFQLYSKNGKSSDAPTCPFQDPNDLNFVQSSMLYSWDAVSKYKCACEIPGKAPCFARAGTASHGGRYSHRLELYRMRHLPLRHGRWSVLLSEFAAFIHCLFLSCLPSGQPTCSRRNR
jgi:hypothetical protein